MSRKQKIKHMSSDELRAKLYSHFQKTGSLDHLRAQLRGQLISELFKIAEPARSDKFPNVCDFEKCVLPLQVCNWLVYDHLSRQDYQYSLSTFVTEAQLPYPEKFLTAGDVLGLLGLKNTANFKNISKLYSINNELGFLHSLLLAIIKTMFHISSKNLSLDTNQSTEAVNSEEILQNGHKESTQYMQSKPDCDINTSYPDLSQLKYISLNKSFITNDAEQSLEKSFLQEIQSFKEENEREVQKMRHRLLNELDNLHAEKCKMQQELEYAKSDLKKEQNKLLKEKEMLKEKEILMEKELANQFELKMRSQESEFAEKLHFKDKEIESLKRKLSEKDEKLAYIEVELSSEKENNSFMKQELNDLKNVNKILQDKYSSLLDQNTNLLRKFESMSDYSLVKDELSVKSREVTRLQNQIKDLSQKSEAERRKYVETVRNLENNLNSKEPQLIQAREEIDEIKDTLKREQALWNKERRKYEYDLKELKKHYDIVIQQLEEKNEEIEDLQQTNDFLNSKLMTSVTSSARSNYTGQYKMHQRVSNQKSNFEMLFAKRNIPFQQQAGKDYDSKFKFFSDKKSSYGALKEEENKVQENYSIILSTIPEYDKQMYYSKNSNFSSFPKKNMNSYNVFSKSDSLSSPFNHDKTKLSTITRNPYSLSDVRQMVFHSLSPNKTNRNVDFLANIKNFASSSQAQNICDTRVKDIWTVPESNCPYNIHKHHSMTETKGNTSALSTTKLRHSVNEGNSIFENPLYVRSLSKKSESNEVEFNNGVIIDNDNSDKLQEGSENTKNLRENSLNKNKVSSGVNKNIASTISENSKIISDEESTCHEVHTLTNQAEKGSANSSQHLHNVASKISENETKSNFSVYVHLDDAWKKRPSVTSVSYREGRMNDTNSTDRPDDTLYPSSFVSNNEIVFKDKQHTVQGKLGKIDSKDVFDKSAENIDNNSLEGNLENASLLELNKNKQIDNCDKEREPSLSNKSTENVHADKEKYTVDTSNEFQILDKEAKLNDFMDTELYLKENKQISYEEINKNQEKAEKTEEEYNGKTSEKTVNIDSLSEQSELHLSCGSEIEQQKEDSDAW